MLPCAAADRPLLGRYPSADAGPLGRGIDAAA